jgi:hypothetical protein
MGAPCFRKGSAVTETFNLGISYGVKLKEFRFLGALRIVCEAFLKPDSEVYKRAPALVPKREKRRLAEMQLRLDYFQK